VAVIERETCRRHRAGKSEGRLRGNWGTRALDEGQEKEGDVTVVDDEICHPDIFADLEPQCVE